MRKKFTISVNCLPQVIKSRYSTTNNNKTRQGSFFVFYVK